MENSERYMIGRVTAGSNKLSKNEYFVLDRTVEKVATMYAHEMIDKAIARIRRSSAINGIKGLCAKQDVIDTLKKLKEEPDFEIPSIAYTT